MLPARGRIPVVRRAPACGGGHHQRTSPRPPVRGERRGGEEDRGGGGGGGRGGGGRRDSVITFTLLGPSGEAEEEVSDSGANSTGYGVVFSTSALRQTQVGDSLVESLYNNNYNSNNSCIALYPVTIYELFIQYPRSASKNIPIKSGLNYPSLVPFSLVEFHPILIRSV